MVNKMKLMKIRDKLVEIHTDLETECTTTVVFDTIDKLGNIIDEFSDIIHNDK